MTRQRLLRDLLRPWYLHCGALLLLALTAVSCGDQTPEGSLVRLHLAKLPDSAAQVVLSVTATDKTGNPKTIPFTFASGPLDILGVTFPAGTTGNTTYQVSVLDGSGCLLGTASASLVLDSALTYELSIELASVPLCGAGVTLSVQVASGANSGGTVTSNPAGISCTGSGSGCTQLFQKGAQITLHAQASSGSFVGWSGVPCVGIGDCTITLTEDTQLQAIFSACHGWCQEPQPAGSVNFYGISGTAPDNIVVVGDSGAVLLWDGQSWQRQTTSAGSALVLRAVTAKLGGTSLYVAGDAGTILQLSSGNWSAITNPLTTTLRGAAIGSSSNIYFVGDSGTLLSLSPTGTAASNKTSNLGAGAGTTLNGASQNPNNLVSDDILIGGSNGYAVQWDGNTGVTLESKSGGGNILNGNINAVLCGILYHYVAGDNGGISRRSSSSGNSIKWQIFTPAPTTQNLRGLWASSDTNIYAVGDGGTILQFDGSTWTPIKVTNQPAFSTNLRAVWGTSKSNVYAVGDNGTILHYLP